MTDSPATPPDVRPLFYEQIPAVGQRALLSAAHPFERTHLASSAHLDPALASELLASPDLTVRGPAAQRADDRALVSAHASGVNKHGGDRHPGTVYRALLNPVCDPDVLVSQLSNLDARFALAAAVNPSTPEESRRAALTPRRVSDMVRTGSSSGDVAIRAAALVEANPWMAESVGSWSAIVHQSLLHLESLTAAQHAQVVASPGRVRFADQHPCVTGVPLSVLSTVELFALDAPVAHLEASRRMDLTLEAANKVLVDKQAASRPVHWLVLARLVERFGPAVGYKADMSGTRLKAAGWLVPAAAHAGLFSPQEAGAAAQAGLVLGGDACAWDTFARLSRDSVLTFEELAAASVALSGPPSLSDPARVVRLAASKRSAGPRQVV